MYSPDTAEHRALKPWYVVSHSGTEYSFMCSIVRVDRRSGQADVRTLTTSPAEVGSRIRSSAGCPLRPPVRRMVAVESAALGGCRTLRLGGIVEGRAHAPSDRGDQPEAGRPHTTLGRA
ncbi:hypothetical protein KACC15558_06230 [Brevibacterium ammoniilyticum]|uniref:Uncharacterized protein n=1 Tax=Brevibacterium ammoniilyticum TaxID=1046555 RepID=A0ABP9TWS7_9MICO